MNRRLEKAWRSPSRSSLSWKRPAENRKIRSSILRQIEQIELTANRTDRAQYCASRSAAHDRPKQPVLSPRKAVRAAARRLPEATAGASAILAAECRCAESASPSREEATRAWPGPAADFHDSHPCSCG